MRNRPNILFVFTDQQRADAVGAFNPAIRTPVMDRLCAKGTAFTNAYTPVPVCVPARCSLIFGQYAHKTDCYENSFPMPETTAERPTFMSLLSEAGKELQAAGVAFENLTDIFKNETRTIYIDHCCHTNRLGSELISREIARRIGNLCRR